MKVRKNIYVIFRFINVSDLLRQKQPTRKKMKNAFCVLTRCCMSLQLNPGLACKARAQIPAAIGALADVPVCEEVQIRSARRSPSWSTVVMLASWLGVPAHTKTTFNKYFGFGSNRLHCRKQDVRKGREERKVVWHGSLRKIKKKTFNKITKNVGKTSNIICIRSATCVHLQMKGRQKRIIGNMFGMIVYV